MIYYISQHAKKSRWVLVLWTSGENACHPERSEGSGEPDAEILRCAQDDSQDSAQVLSREVFSPNVCSRLPQHLTFVQKYGIISLQRWYIQHTNYTICFYSLQLP